MEEVHGYHPRRTAVSTGQIAKMTEYGGRVVALVHPFEPEAPEEEGVSARGVDKKTREPGRRLPVWADRGYSRAPLGPDSPM
jgi:hypothetical protein